MLLLVLFMLLALTVAAPTKPYLQRKCDGVYFNKPWIISNLRIYEPPASSPNQTGTICFHFCDQNEGLQQETDCHGVVTNGSCIGPDDGYVFCANNATAFKLVGPTQLLIERPYINDCLGPYPYDIGLAFGQNDTQATSITTGAGTIFTQTEMAMEITELS